MRKFLSALILAVVACSSSFAMSAADFLPPVQEEDPAKSQELLLVRDNSSVKVERDTSLDEIVTVASTLQDAINKIVEKPKQGCQFVRAEGQKGFTVVATGEGSYNPNLENVVASRIEQRYAYVMAFMRAKSAMLQKLEGISYEGATYFESSMDTETNSSKTLVNLTIKLDERIRQWARAVLKGYVTYAVHDDGKGKVFVTIVSSPKTRGIYNHNGTDGIATGNIYDGINLVIAEVRKGLVPPVGGRIIEVPGTDQIAWVGFGSAVVLKHSEPDIQAELELQAEQIAEMRAINGLAGIINGDDTYFEKSLGSDFSRDNREFERLTKNDPAANGTDQEINEYHNRVREMRQRLSRSEIVRSISNGKLVPGIMCETEIDSDGYFAYGIAVYVPTASDMAATIREDMHNTEIMRPAKPIEENQESRTDNPTTPGKLEIKPGPSGVVEQDL